MYYVRKVTIFNCYKLHVFDLISNYCCYNMRFCHDLL